MRHLLICIVFLLIPGRLLPQLLINEFSSANVSGLTDENGQANDWIELYNNSSLEVNLAGYHLSDNASFLSKWSFPAVKIKPRSYLVIFASDKNRTALPVNYKTIINRGDTWQYLVPSSEPPASWKNPGYSSASWQTGMSGFGYGDNDDSTVISNVLSVYIRKEFTLANIAEIKELVLSIDYDDGFIAYINGHEIARANVGTNVSVPYTQAASPSHEATMYSGGYPDNFVISNPQSFLIEGTNVIAIQGHNSGTSSGDLTLMPVLTTGRYVTDLFDVVPAFTRLKGNRLHTNFKISSEGEKIFLSRPDSLIIDTTGPTELLSNLSCGRDLSVPGKWTFFAVPTPSAPNNTRSYSTINADTVMFSVKGGYYPGGLSLQLSTKAGSDSIFYTTDGSIPTISSSRYTGPISLNGNTVVRAVSIKANMLPGGMVTNTYITTHHTLPVVCISTNPANLWDYYTGIYVMGPNASTVAPYQGANFWQDWEREAHLELYDTNGDKKLDQDIGIKIYGAYSRSRPQKSLALYARKQYGKGSFNYKVFKDKLIDKFEALVLRNSGNDWSLAYLRDGLTSTLVKDMDIDRQAYQPAVIYLNGEYWGIQDIREKINPDYIAENHGVNPASVNLLVSNATVLDGSNTSYNAITSYLNTYSLENDPDYLQVRNKLDINNYIQYQLTQLYIDNRDWPGNNIKFWNTDVPGNPWRWVIYDTDFGFGFKGSTAYTFNNIDYALVPDSPSGANRPWATLLFRKMMTNAGFRKEFANQYADRINRNFSPERVSFVIDSLRNIYLPEIDAHLARWNLTRTNWDNQY
ncbi:MAG: CotH kinase family protein, partial [Bacteroidales bacterium]